MKWFGESWGAPICRDVPHADTPVGWECIRCEKPIEQGQHGMITPLIKLVAGRFIVDREVAYHHRCFMESIFGGSALALCHCCREERQRDRLERLRRGNAPS